MVYDVLVIGGGAAGFFSAINIASQRPEWHIAILERGSEVLTKVKVSGGGRCNVTHAEFVPNSLAKNYPRGEKELRGPFHSFMSGDVMEWFEQKGVALKIEEDGRVFPVSDSSQTIIDCFLSEAKKYNISIFKGNSVHKIGKYSSSWEIQTSKGAFRTKQLIVATGSNPKIWELLKELGHSIIDPVPSLFTFNIRDKRIEGLAGVSTQAVVSVLKNKRMGSESQKANQLKSEGPLLITHWGMSGPAILKLSAWGARTLHKCNYQFSIVVNWMGTTNLSEAIEMLKDAKETYSKKKVFTTRPFSFPKRLWEQLLPASGISQELRWADLSKKQLEKLSEELTQGVFLVHGKSTFKEEFVTAGGVDLKEIDFKTFKSKMDLTLYLIGEVLNIDAITGGFNFQNAWTGGYLAAKDITTK